MFGLSKFWEKNETPVQTSTNTENANGSTSATSEARSQAAGSEQIAIGAQNSKDNPPATAYGDLWKLSEEQQKKQDGQPLAIFGDDVTPEKVMEAARQMDFTKAVPPEILEKVLSGDQTALLQLINQVGQGAYGQAAMTSVNASKIAAEKTNEHWQSKLPELVRGLTQRNELSENNLLATDPATKPMYDLMLTQFQKKYPDATAEQLKTHTSNYLKEFVTKAGGTMPEPAQEEKPKINANIGGTDSWNNFFD